MNSAKTPQQHNKKAARHHQPAPASPFNPGSRKVCPASRSERLLSWNQRMQSLFTRQTY